jgi:hypothetical protein
MFGERYARRSLRRFRRKGLGGEARLMAEWAAEKGLDGTTVLEVGGGIGAIQADLLRAGAAHGTVVEVVPDYEPFAAEAARAAGVAERSAFVVANLVEDPAVVDPADVVALQRVVCCSPDGVRLLGAAAGLTRRVLVASYPRRSAWVRAAVWAQNAAFRLLGREFRAFVHDPDALAAAAAEHGLERERLKRGRVWETASFTRIGAAAQ